MHSLSRAKENHYKSTEMYITMGCKREMRQSMQKIKKVYKNEY